MALLLSAVPDQMPVKLGKLLLTEGKIIRVAQLHWSQSVSSSTAEPKAFTYCSNRKAAYCTT